jgi:hypothetical protein
LLPFFCLPPVAGTTLAVAFVAVDATPTTAALGDPLSLGDPISLGDPLSLRDPLSLGDPISLGDPTSASVRRV